MWNYKQLNNMINYKIGYNKSEPKPFFLARRVYFYGNMSEAWQQVSRNYKSEKCLINYCNKNNIFLHEIAH